MQQEEITLQTLTDNEDIRVGYSDNDIVIIDSIQKFAEFSAAHVSMNAITICTQGKVQGTLNGQPMEMHKNQAAIIPQNVIVSDLLVSPDFDLKALFLTNRILQGFLREKMPIWNDVVYVRKMHIPAAGLKGTAGTDLPVHLPRSVDRQVHVGPHRRHVFRQDCGIRG